MLSEIRQTESNILSPLYVESLKKKKVDTENILGSRERVLRAGHHG